METKHTPPLKIGDEGMWRGGLRRIKGFDDIGNVVFVELDEQENEQPESERKASLESFQKEFAKF